MVWTAPLTLLVHCVGAEGTDRDRRLLTSTTSVGALRWARLKK